MGKELPSRSQEEQTRYCKLAEIKRKMQEAKSVDELCYWWRKGIELL